MKIKEVYNKLSLSKKIIGLAIISIIVIWAIDSVHSYYEQYKINNMVRQASQQFEKQLAEKEKKQKESREEEQLELQQKQLNELQDMNDKMRDMKNQLDDLKRRQQNEY